MGTANAVDELRRRSEALASHPFAPWVLRAAYVVLAVGVAMALWMGNGHVTAKPTLTDAIGPATPSARGTDDANARLSSQSGARGAAVARD